MDCKLAGRIFPDVARIVRRCADAVEEPGILHNALGHTPTSIIFIRKKTPRFLETLRLFFPLTAFTVLFILCINI